jgi:hypothetical protein
VWSYTVFHVTGAACKVVDTPGISAERAVPNGKLLHSVVAVIVVVGVNVVFAAAAVVVIVMAVIGMMIIALSFDLPLPVPLTPLCPQNSHHSHFPELV